MSELKPCPFCGSDDVALDEFAYRIGDGEWESKVICYECHANTGFYTKQEAVEAWNRRAT